MSEIAGKNHFAVFRPGQQQLAELALGQHHYLTKLVGVEAYQALNLGVGIVDAFGHQALALLAVGGQPP